MTAPAIILCFTDVLCGACYVADAALEQLQARFAGRIQISYHFMSVFGDVRRRIARSGKSRDAYGAMVRAALEQCEHVAVHPGVFRDVTPSSSVPAHLYLRAVKILEDEGAIDVGSGPTPFERLLKEARASFFRDLRDISKREVLDEIAEQLDIPVGQVARILDDGRAFAELSHDAELRLVHTVSVAPTLVLDDGRHLAAGNVSYPDLDATISELLPSRVAQMRCC